MSKAAEKRRKSLVESLTTKLGRTLKSFENKYMNSYTEWSMLPIKKGAESHKGLNTKEDFFNEFEGKPWSKIGMETPTGRWASPTIDHDTAYGIYLGKLRCVSAMKVETLTRFNFMTEANKGYQIKFSRLVEKVADGLGDVDTYNRLSVETVRSSGSELEFLICVSGIEVHARAIFVNGAIKAPHYRFITTTRK